MSHRVTFRDGGHGKIRQFLRGSFATFAGHSRRLLAQDCMPDVPSNLATLTQVDLHVDLEPRRVRLELAAFDVSKHTRPKGWCSPWRRTPSARA
jgi:hypothetical protein